MPPIKDKYPDVTYADLFQLASATAIEEASGPKIPMKYGRVDVSGPDQCPEEGRLPDAGPPSPAAHLRDVFYRMGLDDKEIVALSGAHTLGRGRSVDVDFSNGMSHLLLQLSKRFAFRCSSSVHELRFCAGAGLATFCDLLFGFSGLEADPTLLIAFFDVTNSSKFLLCCCVPFSTASIVCVFWWMPAVFASIIRKLISFWVLGMIIHW
ncbi:putative L-ascorbate peroxidase 7, chloroplastic [Sarracenia purpurea var. burkii]